jgi:hypothetical protein
MAALIARVPRSAASRTLFALRGLFTKQRLTHFEIESTDDANFVLRTLTPEAHAWSEKFLAEPLPNGDRIVSSAIVAAVAAEAIERGYLVRFV